MMDRRDAKDAQRLDKWLWHARIVKTRSLAAQLVAQGKMRVNREKVLKPAHLVRCGDVITAAIHGRVRVLQISGFSLRRGTPAQAQMLYSDLTPREAGLHRSGVPFDATDEGAPNEAVPDAPLPEGKTV